MMIMVNPDIAGLRKEFKATGFRERMMEMLKMVGLDDDLIDDISGGLWSRYKGIIVVSMADRYPVTDLYHDRPWSLKRMREKGGKR